MENRELALPRTWAAITSYKRGEEWRLHRSSLYISDKCTYWQSHLAADFNLKRNYKQIKTSFSIAYDYIIEVCLATFCLENNENHLAH